MTIAPQGSPSGQVVPMAPPLPAGVMDLEPLLAPISEERPTGEWLRFDPIYDEIQRLRQEDDPALPQGVWQRELKRADWHAMERACIEALTTRTKDLQIAAWLTEAWVRVHGFTGFAAGVRLSTQLCRLYWPDLYPALDPDSPDTRLAPIAWLNRLALPLQSIPLNTPSSEEPVTYGWRHWEEGLRLAKVAVKDAQAAAKAEQKGAVTQAKFLVALSLTPGAWYRTLNDELTAARTAVVELDAFITEKCGEAQAPSLAALRDLLQSIQSLVARVVRERIEKGELAAPAPPAPPPTLMDEPMSETSDVAPTATVPVVPRVGSIASRADAYRAMAEASEFLMRTEPHSPVPYLVRRAIAWGNMSLADLLEELLQKNTDINTIYALLGMKRPG